MRGRSVPALLELRDAAVKLANQGKEFLLAVPDGHTRGAAARSAEERTGGKMWRGFLTSAGLQVLPYLLAPAGELDGKLLRDLLEIRVMLLGWTAAKAAERSAGVTASKLRLALERLDAETEIRGIQEADFDFFEKLVELTDNQVLNLLANAVRQVYMQNSELFGALYLSPGGTEFHHETLRAVEAGDVAAARAAMEAYGRRFLEEGP